jgi:hypothetical protein
MSALGALQASSINIANRAYGGGGSNRDAGSGAAGTGGRALADSRVSSNVASKVDVLSIAVGGAAGIGTGGAGNGYRGDTSAMAIAETRAGAASATAEADGGANVYGVGARAYAQAMGATSSIANASTTGTAGILPRVELTAHAHSDIGGKVVASTGTGAQSYHDGNNPFTPLLNVASVTSIPDFSTAVNALTKAPAVHENFNARYEDAVLGMVTLGGGVETAVADTSLHLFSSSVTLALDMSDIAQPMDLLLGMISGDGTGAGFQSLHFRLDQEGSTVIDETFTSLTDAEAFFNDTTVNLGAWWSTISGDNILDLAFFLDVEQFGSTAGGFKTTMLFGNSLIDRGPTPAVPLPAGFWLFGSALAGLAGHRRWSRR